MKRTSKIGLILLTAATLLGCSTARQDKINLFDRNSYIVTAPPAVVDGVATKEPGMWLSKRALLILQDSGELAGKLE